VNCRTCLIIVASVLLCFLQFANSHSGDDMAKKFKGRRFERLRVVGDSGQRQGNRILWSCRCKCGEMCLVTRSSLVTGNTRSCGCLRRDVARQRRTTHGEAATPLYWVYRGMRDRCSNPKHKSYATYGGRGIRVCARWLGREGYTNFLADMGRPPFPGATIDRKRNNGPYSPGNCQWTSRATQNRNRSGMRWITANGETLCMADWAKRLGMVPAGVLRRLNAGWDPVVAVTTPPKRK